MKRADLYHSGIVVDDLQAAKCWYTVTAGYCWTKVIRAPQLIWTPEGRRLIMLKICYSGENLSHRLELIETIPGTIWVPSDSGVHHHGRWSADVDADAAVLARHGYTVEAKALAPNGSALWAYCRGPIGPRIELVGPWMRPLVRLFLTTAKRGRGAGIAPGPFPHAARRTRRTDLSVTGSPRFLPVRRDWGGPWGWVDEGVDVPLVRAPLAFPPDAEAEEAEPVAHVHHLGFGR